MLSTYIFNHINTNIIRLLFYYTYVQRKHVLKLSFYNSLFNELYPHIINNDTNKKD